MDGWLDMENEMKCRCRFNNSNNFCSCILDVLTFTGQPAEGHSRFWRECILLSDDYCIHAFVLRRSYFRLFGLVWELFDNRPGIINYETSYIISNGESIDLFTGIWKRVLVVESDSAIVINEEITWFRSSWWSRSRWNRRKASCISRL